MTGYLVLLVGLAVFYFWFHLKFEKNYRKITSQFNKKDFQLVMMTPVFLNLIEKLKILERFHSRVSVIQQKIMILYGYKDAFLRTKMFVAHLFAIGYICLFGTTLFVLLANGDKSIFLAGCFMSILIPIVMVKKLGDEVKNRQGAILTEIPEFVNKMILLINAGETVHMAFIRSVYTKRDSDHPLYKELKEAAIKIENNEPFQLALSELSKRCTMQEVSIFTTTVLLNYRKGGQDLVLALQELSHDLWKRRKSISKTKREEASSKLVFPLALIFIAVMCIVGWPALQMM